MSTRLDPTNGASRAVVPVPGSASPEADDSDHHLGEGASQARPQHVTWEMTRSCEWKSLRPRTKGRAARERQPFSTAEAFHLVDEVASLHVPLLTLTGGDPLLRPDLFPILEFAVKRSVRTSLTLLPTLRVDAEAIADLKATGAVRAGFWMHGSTASLDDGCWKIPGCHRRTLDIIGACHEVQLPVQVNTMLTRRNLHDLENMVDLLTRLDVGLWNVFFLVPASREECGELMTAEQHEDVFAKLYDATERVHFRIRTTEGQHYQRYLLQQRVRATHGRMSDANTTVPDGMNDSRRSIFVDHHGDVYPSRFLPISAGSIASQSLAEIYRGPLLASLRDDSRLKGNCGRCPMQDVCGGSRARAYAMTGDLFAADPCCAYEP